MSTEKRVFSKLFKKEKVELSVISDLQGAYEQFDNTISQRFLKLGEISDSYREVLSLLADLNYELGLYEDIESTSEDLRVTVSDILTEVENKAEELGADASEFIPQYDDIVGNLGVLFDDDVIREARELATGY